MNNKEELKELFGEGLFYTGFSRIQLIDEVASRNNVSRNTVYNWLNDSDAVSRGRVKATLNKLIEESKTPKVITEFTDEMFK